MKTFCLAAVGLVSVTLSLGAMADTPDSQKATSKTYVDNLVATKQQKFSDTAGTVVTYTDTAGTVGKRAIYANGDTWNSATQVKLIEANQANTAIQNGLNQHLTCGDRDPATQGCLYWSINSTANQVYMP